MEPKYGITHCTACIVTVYTAGDFVTEVAGSVSEKSSRNALTVTIDQDEILGGIADRAGSYSCALKTTCFTQITSVRVNKIILRVTLALSCCQCEVSHT
jgi:hypothetical protein